LTYTGCCLILLPHLPIGAALPYQLERKRSDQEAVLAAKEAKIRQRQEDVERQQQQEMTKRRDQLDRQMQVRQPFRGLDAVG